MPPRPSVMPVATLETLSPAPKVPKPPTSSGSSLQNLQASSQSEGGAGPRLSAEAADAWGLSDNPLQVLDC